jgi:hypothetical protein
LKQKLARAHERTLDVVLFNEVTRNLGLDVGVYKSVEGADPFLVNGNILLLDFDDLDLERRRRR